jgi:hypothetical protein
MIWRTASLLFLLVCYLHGVSAASSTQKSTLEDAIYADLEPKIICNSSIDHRPLRIEDCYSALSLMADKVNQSKWELVHNGRDRALRQPSRMDRALSQGRFRLPADIRYESCVIRVELELGRLIMRTSWEMRLILKMMMSITTAGESQIGCRSSFAQGNTFISGKNGYHMRLRRS